jgi:hypothetical protein
VEEYNQREALRVEQEQVAQVVEVGGVDATYVEPHDAQ